MPGGPVAWSLFWMSALISLGGAVGVLLAFRRFQRNGGESLSPIAALGSVLVLLMGFFGMLISLNLWGNLGA
ncbi:MAG: hypothetical protein HOH95_05655 [Dehalococcoidia bacterium]|mgnify:FL=1|jgi:hypothetical protein|nr:hypothetical protein [Dehalococcoidia bacterium]